MRFRAIPILLGLALTAGCATDGAGKPSRRPGPSPAKPAEVETTGPRTPLKPGTGKEFTPEERAKMEVAWEAFKDESPTWPSLRDEWISLGPRATATLVENLLRAMILSHLANFPHGVQRSRKELVLIGSPAIPLLTAVLEEPVWYNARTRKTERLPSDVQTEVNELLMLCGRDAVPSLVRLTRSDVPTVRRNAMSSLGRMKAPEGVPILADLLARAESWIDRVVAARALGFGEDPRGEQALVRALSDPDEAVVIESARSLARRGAAGALSALQARRERARAKEEYRTSRALGEAIRIIRGRQP